MTFVALNTPDFVLPYGGKKRATGCASETIE